MSRFQILFTAACLVLAALFGAAVFTAAQRGGPAPVTSTGKADVGGPFQLVDQYGNLRDESLLKGRWTAVFFGFTYCPDVCPLTLQTLTEAKARLGAEGRDLQFVFVTVDPERDTPAQLKAYLDSDAFPPGVIGLTGTPDQVAAAAKAWRVYYKRAGEGPDYLMDHSTQIFLMNPDGEFSRVLAHGLGPDKIAEQIRDARRKGA